MSHRTTILERLDAIGRALAQRPSALALIGLGSTGRELERLDEYSDLDFFVIVESSHKQNYLDDLSWLSEAHPLAYTFLNSAEGYKFLYADGIYGEMAIFTPEELAAAAYAPGRLVWRRDDVPVSWATPPGWPPPRPPADIDWLVGEALTNLYVGLCRFRRGEKLSAFRFIQGYAIDRVVELADFMESANIDNADRFDGPRRFEWRYPRLAAVLPSLMRGYERSPEAAAAILAVLDAHFKVNPAMRKAIMGLLDR